MSQTTDQDDTVRNCISGSVIPVRGDDIDTDRIIPARYLRTVTFDGLGEHAFEDDRVGGAHPFDNPNYAGATVLLANDNFGCGSSREHAPQALMHWGIRLFIAESFAEIFFGNCVTLGLPCMQATSADVDRLMASIDADPSLIVDCDISAQEVRFGTDRITAAVPAGPRQQFLDGSWDALGQLLAEPSAIDAAAARLPYISGF
jgi:3-isopropylmalate/(R)-2-methylmalate dehydratase small subunit